MPFLHITTRIPGKKHDDLLKEKGFRGFPSLCFMDSEGKVVTNVHYTKRSIEGFVAARDAATRLVQLAKRAETDAAAAKELLFLKLELKTLKFAAGKAAADEMQLTPKEKLRFQTLIVETLTSLTIARAQAAAASLDLLPGPKQRVTEILNDLEIREALRPLSRGFRPGIDPEPPYHIPYDLYKKGVRPSDKPVVNSLYWSGVLRTAFGRRDLKAFEAAYTRVRPIAEKQPDERWLRTLARQRAELQAAARDK